MIRLLAEQERQRIEDELQEAIENGWVGYWSEGEQSPYYHNVVSSEVVWQLPEGVRARSLLEPPQSDTLEVVRPAIVPLEEPNAPRASTSSSTRSSDFAQNQEWRERRERASTFCYRWQTCDLGQDLARGAVVAQTAHALDS